MSKIDFEKVVTREDLVNFDATKYEQITKDANFHSNYIRRAFPSSFLQEYLPSRAKELAYIGHQYKDEDNTFKGLLAARITYNDDEKVIRILLEKGVGYSTLRAYSNLISKTKQLHNTVKELGLEESDDITISNRKLNAICKILHKYYGFSEHDITLSKINELVVFKRTLYIQMEHSFDGYVKVK